MAYTEFTLWLTPGEPLRSTLRSTIIRRLAARLDAVEFEPHVTVFCGPSTDAEARAVARRIARQFPPIKSDRRPIGPYGTLYQDAVCAVSGIFRRSSGSSRSPPQAYSSHRTIS